MPAPPLGIRTPKVSAHRTNWPITGMLIATVLLFLATAMLTSGLDPYNGQRSAVQAVLFLIPLGRTLLAARRRERSRIWVGYLAAMTLILPLCLLVLDRAMLWAIRH